MAYYSISNDFVSRDNGKFKVLGLDCFAIYNYLILKQGLSESSNFTIKELISYFNRSSDKILKYSNRQVKISKLKDTRIIKKCIQHLIGLKYINSDTNIEGINVNSTIIYSIDSKTIREDGNYSRIDNELFKNYIHKIGHIGWSIYFVLYRLHNETFGGEQSQGYATPSIKYIEEVLGISNKTIISYIELIENCKLVSIHRSEPEIIGQDKDGNDLYKTPSNQYLVKAKCKSYKYYIE